ncbi:MAG: ParB/RepB/Spo0J family partition protein [Rhodothermaceae bacterium]|nr:ParB/RepB/Spo0J family partition protein [Rhodothermaceae bacterium]MYC05464.1 ParB/RepB/Spo0J family partition protein [Rhodothermaceae bacterium]MYI17287.1 ParB/RepB/Spo0J family partition protein [Rhodothermaceae bacterium]
MSVGYGTHKKGRPLSPVEVGKLIRQATEAGVSTKQCSKAIKLDQSGISRFLRILDLPEETQHLISWGAQKGSIGFSAATQLVRLEDADDQQVVVQSILSEGLNSKEIQQVVQLKTRSDREIKECLEEVLDMRPVIEKRHVFIGTVENRDLESILANLTQAERDSILQSSIIALDLDEVSGRLGKKLFTLVGSDSLDIAVRSVGPDNLEEQLITLIQQGVDHV